MKAPIECDEDVLRLLLRTERKHIDYLVDVLTDEGQGRLALSTAVRDLLLREKAEEESYTESALRLLLNEFQAYGGHSVINLFRKEPLPYIKLLRGVHRKLNGAKSDNKAPSQLEREIVVGLFGKEWQTVPDHTRLKLSTEMKVISGFFDLADRVKTYNSGRNYGLPVAANIAVFATTRLNPLLSIGEAYRITIPFVAQLAYIKMLST